MEFRECDPHTKVICFGFLLVLTPSNWEELVRRLVRYLFSKSTHAHSTNRNHLTLKVKGFYHEHSASHRYEVGGTYSGKKNG